jgi:hypothetical protein
MFAFGLITNLLHPELAQQYEAREQARAAAYWASPEGRKIAAEKAEEAKLAALWERHRKRCGLDQPAEQIVAECQTDESRAADRAVMRNQILRDEYRRRFGD